jgi:gliding motility-associated-like protein
VYRDTIVREICEGERFLDHATSGIYTDRLQSLAGCDSFVTTHLTVRLRPRPILPADTTICLGNNIVLRPTGGGPYTWQDGSSADTFNVHKEGIYTVISTNACGSGSDAVSVKVKPCTPYFPTAFSPNNDGRNERFGVLQSWLVKNYRLTVYNRWGEAVFTTTDPGKGWDGKCGGMQQDTNIFLWQSTFTLDGKVKSEKGTVMLIR